MRTPLVVLLAVALVTLGCVGLTGEVEATAMDHRDEAADRAAAWADDAVLVLVMGLEIANGTTLAAESDFDEGEPFTTLGAHDDGEVGDGRAPAWLYGYASAARSETWGWVLDADGQPLWEGALDDDAHPIGDWRIDSDEAVAIAKANNATWADVSNEDHAFEMLVGTEEDPLWVLGVQREDQEAFVMVNATDGTYLGPFDLSFPAFSRTFDIGPFMVPEESGREAGRLTAAQPGAAHAFALEHDGHDRLYVTLRLLAPTPITSLQLVVVGPDDAEEASTMVGGPPDGGDGLYVYGQVHVEDPKVGSWQVGLQGDGFVAQEYELGWCAPGFDVDVDLGGSPTDWDPCEER